MWGFQKANHLYWLVAAFAMVALAFLVATVVQQRSMASIETEVADLQANSLPSVHHLANARTTVRDARRELSDMRDAEAGVQPESLERITRLRAALDPELGAYRATPWYAGERELFDTELVPSLELFDAELGQLRQAKDAPGGRQRVSLRRLLSDADAVDRALAELLDLNHVQADAATARILQTRHESARLAVQLDIVCSLIAVAAAWLAIRASRRFAKLSDANAQLLGARADELETFAQRVAHDLLSPMSAVAFTLGMIARRHPDPQTKTAVERASRALDRARRMVQGIFNFARAGARPRADARAALLASVRASVDDLLASDPESAPTVEVEPFEECAVACDEAVLGVILSNLLANAAKFTKEAPFRRVAMRARIHPDRARVEVEDTGPGLPPGFESAVFEPYVRAPGVAQPGLGLGLATVKRLVLAHGGAVGAQRGEVGALFWFELPRPSGAAQRDAQAGEATEGEAAAAHPVH